MSLLANIESAPQPLPPRLVLYGTEGVGKSTFGAGAPAPIFLPTEDGLGTIAAPRFPLFTRFSDFLAALEELYRAPHDYQTVVLDSLDWLERLVWDDLCDEYGVTSIEKVDGGYSRGYTIALGRWRRLLDALDRLRRERGMLVIGIAHAHVERFQDPESTSYDRYAPRLHKHASALVCEWADAVLFATRKIRVATEDVGFNRTRGIAHPLGKEGGDRVLRTIGGPSCVAKNRYGLPEELPLSWPAFMSAFTNRLTQ